MPYSNTRKVISVETIEWVVEGEYVEDTQYLVNLYYILANCEGGERYVHEVVFSDPDDLQAALAKVERFVNRVEARGVINLAHWGFHEYFSLTLEQKWDAEFRIEQAAQKGHVDQIPKFGYNDHLETARAA